MFATSTRLVTALFCLSVLACAGEPPVPPASEDARLNEFFDSVFERRVAERPELQSRLGRRTDRLGEWNDPSDAFSTEQVAKDETDLARLRADFDYEVLSDQGKLSYDLFVFNIERRVGNHEFLRHFYVVDQFNGQFTDLLTVLQNNHPVASVGDSANIDRPCGTSFRHPEPSTKQLDTLKVFDF